VLDRQAAAIVEAIRALTAVGRLLTGASAETTAVSRGAESHPPTETSVRLATGTDARSALGTLLLDQATISHLPAEVRETLANLGIDPVTTTLPAMVKLLRIELGTTERMLR